MDRIPFATQFYVLASQQASCEDLLNFYVEGTTPEGRGSKLPTINPVLGSANVIIRSTPGLVEAITVGTGPILAMDGSLPGTIYVVSGTHAYRVNFGPTTTITDLGYIGPIPNPYTTGVPAKIVTIAVGVLAVIVCNPPNAYQGLHSASSLAEITDANYPGADSVFYLDGFFAFSLGDELFCSDLLDAGTYPPLNFDYADSTPNTIQRGITLGSDIWMMGYGGIEVFYDAGTANFPFAPRSGGAIPQGCRNAASISICNGTLIWLGIDGVVYQNNGYRATPVSTKAIEDWMKNHGDYENLDAFSYNQSGHWFYILNFYTAAGSVEATFVYDLSTKLWHRRASTTDGTGVYRAMRAAQLGEQALFGDRTTGQIFTALESGNSDAGVQVLRQVVLPPIYANTKRAFMSRLELECQIGEATSSPTINLDYSDDGGFTYSSPKAASTAATPDYTKRVFWTRLGSFRQRTIRFTCSDRAVFFAADANITGSKS